MHRRKQVVIGLKEEIGASKKRKIPKKIGILYFILF
jgi:hypothetical protein